MIGGVEMTKTIKILSLIAVVITLSSCSKQQKHIVKDYTADINEMNIEINMVEYMDAFEDYLNYRMGECKESELNRDLISDKLISDIETYDNPVEVEGDGEGLASAEEDIVYDEPIDEPVEYPIFDIKGNIIGYGSKEESDESFKLFESMPYYTVEYGEGYDNILLFKVYNKGQQMTTAFYCELDELGKIIKFSELRMG